MFSVPNQRIISVKKAKADKNNLYAIFNLEALQRACNLLVSKAGFKLYVYCARHQNNFTFALSREDFMQYANVAETAYKTAVNELITYGYLVETETKGRYIFNELGNRKEKELINQDKEETEQTIFSF